MKLMIPAIIAGIASITAILSSMPTTSKVTPSEYTYSLWYYGDIIDTGMSLDDCVTLLDATGKFSCIADGKTRTGYAK